MPLFDLGDSVCITRQLQTSRRQTYELSRQVIEGYQRQGYEVSFSEENSPAGLVADISDRKGTQIRTELSVARDEGLTQLRIQLAGKIFVGGMQGMLASEGKVRSVAGEKLGSFLDQVFRGVEPEPEVEVAAPAPAAAEAVAAPPVASAAPAPGPAPTANSGGSATSGGSRNGRSLEERLALVKELHDKGLISDGDFKRRKQQMLSSI